MRRPTVLVCILLLALVGIWHARQNDTIAAQTLQSIRNSIRDTGSGEQRAKIAEQRVRPSLESALAAKNLHFGDPVFLRAFKEEKQLELWVRQRASGKYELFRTWDIAATSGDLGPKLAEGDGQVPEGFYSVVPALMKPDSAFHLAFNIGYPNAYDRAHGRSGSFIMIHGNVVSIGCLAMTDEKIEEIYTLCDAAFKKGQQRIRVHLFPFRMSTERMEKEAANPWIGFWKELKTGHDWFETHRIPPNVGVEEKSYTFSSLQE